MLLPNHIADKNVMKRHHHYKKKFIIVALNKFSLLTFLKTVLVIFISIKSNSATIYFVNNI